MKRFCRILVTACLFFTTVIFSHSVSSSKQCIEVINSSPTSVLTETVPGPGYQPTVKPNQKIILSGDYMQSCFGGQCGVSIVQEKNQREFILTTVPVGGSITYLVNNHYLVNPNAHLKCPH